MCTGILNPFKSDDFVCFFYYPQISSTKRRLPASILSHFAGLELTRYGVDCSRSSAHILTGISLTLVGLLSKVRFFFVRIEPPRWQCGASTNFVCASGYLWRRAALDIQLSSCFQLCQAVSSCPSIFYRILQGVVLSCAVSAILWSWGWMASWYHMMRRWEWCAWRVWYLDALAILCHKRSWWEA